jgi:nitrite reductase/ring-hydroxylating ferredoxin subunit
MVWSDVASVDEVPVGKMKHVEVAGKEILIANVDGRFYAVDDRCGHMNARLSRGSLRGNIVTCPMHAAQFDVTTGKKVAEPTLGGHLHEMDKLPPSFLKMIEHSGKIMAEVKTYDQRTYPLSVDGKAIKIKLP